ncbi:MAG: hypothetical protein ACFB0B_15285, partial [Thermonemataceae bacterium]
SRRGEGGKLVDNLFEWCRARNVPVEARFAIAKKIHKEGWDVPNAYNVGGVLSDVFTEQLKGEIKTRIAAQVKITLLEGL